MKHLLALIVFYCLMNKQARLQTSIAPIIGVDYFQSHIEIGSNQSHYITPQDDRFTFTYGGQLQQNISGRASVGASVMHTAKDFNALFLGFVISNRKSRIQRWDYSFWGYYDVWRGVQCGLGGTYSSMKVFSYLDQNNLPKEVKEVYWAGASLAYQYGDFWLELRYNHGLKTRSIVSNGDTQDYFFRSPPTSTALTLRYHFQVLPLKNRRKEKCPEF